MKFKISLLLLAVTLYQAHTCFAPAFTPAANQPADIATIDQLNTLTQKLNGAKSLSLSELEKTLREATQFVNDILKKPITTDQRTQLRELYKTLTDTKFNTGFNSIRPAAGVNKSSFDNQKSTLLNKTIQPLIDKLARYAPTAAQPKPSTNKPSGTVDKPQIAPALTPAQCLVECTWGRLITTPVSKLNIVRDANVCIPVCSKNGHPKAAQAMIEAAQKKNIKLTGEAAQIAAKLTTAKK